VIATGSIDNLENGDGLWWIPELTAKSVKTDSTKYLNWNKGTATSTTVEWPGAFVGTENQDGSVCENASAYSGITFRIKGSVATTGKDPWGTDWTNTIVVSLVTAATREKTLGGDAPRECGHYHWTVTNLTSNWQTQTLNFANLEEPWGLSDSDVDCSFITGYDLTKIVGLDFGVDTTYTDFTVDIDDIAYKTN
jgi:hypothetical protein